MARNLYRATSFRGLYSGTDRTPEPAPRVVPELIIDNPEQAYRHYRREMQVVYRSKFNIYLLSVRQLDAARELLAGLKLRSRDTNVALLYVHHMVFFAAQAARLDSADVHDMLGGQKGYVAALVEKILLFNRTRDEVSHKATFLALCKELQVQSQHTRKSKPVTSKKQEVQQPPATSSPVSPKVKEKLGIIRKDLLKRLESREDPDSIKVRKHLEAVGRPGLEKILCAKHEGFVLLYGHPKKVFTKQDLLDRFFRLILTEANQPVKKK